MTASSLPQGLPSFHAPAKLNLFLHITGRRPDGYHNLQTVFQILDYGDQLAFEVRQDGRICRMNEVEGVAEEDDLVVRAAKVLQKEAGCSLGANIYMHKVLPMGGGLGGGSSDAATVLRALDRLWGCHLPVERLSELGRSLGADVPVFVEGSSAWAEGVGECLSPLSIPEKWYLVIKPDAAISTAKLFSSERLTRDCDPITLPAFQRGAGENVFQPLVEELYPEVRQVIEWLGQFSKAALTGTGSCVFAAFESQSEAEEVRQKIPENWFSFIARGVNESPLLEDLDALR